METDFFKMEFSKLFLEKQGENIFNEIINQITKENSNKDRKDSIEVVFKVAFFDFIGLSENITENIMKNNMLIEDINIKEIKLVHKNSIKLIRRYLQDTIDGIGDKNNRTL